mmetsp:Transcript_21674/g.42092  ORF Transcript_21674/g.42092 Transcript_21674/m.42092 type:complete len:112 (+) Transcript_21674:1136-1471(+)
MCLCACDVKMKKTQCMCVRVCAAKNTMCVCVRVGVASSVHGKGKRASVSRMHADSKFSLPLCCLATCNGFLVVFVGIDDLLQQLIESGSPCNELEVDRLSAPLKMSRSSSH